MRNIALPKAQHKAPSPTRKQLAPILKRPNKYEHRNSKRKSQKLQYFARIP
jgi:hypothetical protein